MKIAGRDMRLTNLDKILYPGNRFTKGQVIEYYTRVAPYLLPHLRDRPITLKRYPDGVTGEFFYEKNAPRFTPDWIAKHSIPHSHRKGSVNYILINDLATLVWCANLADLEMHPFLAKAPDIDIPTMIVFDLDPGPGVDILGACEAALLVKELLDRLNLESFIKVSGSKGVHLHVPLNTKATYEATKPFAQSIAETLEQQHPDRVVATMAKAHRQNKIFVDWSQNSEHKTTVAAYSLRATRDRPQVALPIEWGELKRAIKKKQPELLFFEPEAALKRLEKTGDLFAPILTLKQELPEPFLALHEPKPIRNNLPQRRKGAKEKPEAFRTSRGKSPKDSSDALDAYRRKRDFAKTPEPPPARSGSAMQAKQRQFVIQKHAARRLHYDFRLAMDGVLKSWAVPKGPPFDQAEKRLAMATEDHPLDYADFEGIIPKGEYGGGTVMVWDTGIYEVIDGNYEQGKLHILLDGKKLKGEWVLVKSKGGERKDNQWLMIKAGGAQEHLTAAEEDRSALTGRSMQQIAEAADALRHSNNETGQKPARSSFVKKQTSATGENHQSRAKGRLENSALEDSQITARNPTDLPKLPKTRAKFIEPMLAKAVPELPENDGSWLYELKLDGYRGLAVKGKEKVELFSRNHNLLNGCFPKIAAALESLDPETVLDGEIVALDEQGRPSFNILQNYRSSAAQICYYAFDLPIYQGENLHPLPLEQRRDLLNDIVGNLPDPIRFSQGFAGSAQQLIEAARDLGMEGLLAKKRDSLYEAGERSGAWVKYRINKGQELVIGGYIPAAHYFDSLLVGYYRGNQLMFVAKIRNGFVPRLRREIFERFKGLETQDYPFANLPERKSARRGIALTAEAMKECRWLKPKLVAQIEFAEWTESDHLRHSKFVALRDDKSPRAVTREAAL